MFVRVRRLLLLSIILLAVFTGTVGKQPNAGACDVCSYYSCPPDGYGYPPATCARMGPWGPCACQLSTGVFKCT